MPSTIVSVGPPETSVFLSSLPLRNTISVPSADQNGKARSAPVVSGSTRASSAFSGRTHRLVPDSVSPENTICRPSGDSAMLSGFSVLGVWISNRTSGRGVGASRDARLAATTIATAPATAIIRGDPERERSARPRRRLGSGRRRVGRVRRDDVDFGDETVAAPGLGHDESVLVGRFAERAPEHRNVLVEVALFDYEVRPDRRHHRAFLERFTGVLDEKEQRVEQLRFQRNRLAVRAEQHSP